jgi:hypothetical protein
MTMMHRYHLGISTVVVVVVVSLIGLDAPGNAPLVLRPCGIAGGTGVRNALCVANALFTAHRN